MAVTNKFGRKPGRGIRPWLLMPKILGVAIYFGALVGAAGVWFARNDSIVDQSARVETISFIVRFVAVPGLLVAIVFGAALFAQHPHVFVRMRWWRVKIASLFVLIPALHFYMSIRLAEVRAALGEGGTDGDAEHGLTIGFAAAMAGAVWVIVLGRMKPRLGQNIAKALARTNERVRADEV